MQSSSTKIIVIKNIFTILSTIATTLDQCNGFNYNGLT